MNIYEMYVFNGNKANFVVHRTSWSPITYAVVQVVQGKTSGELLGKPPYYDNKAVSGVLYKGDQLIDPDYIFTCPGTYKTFRFVSDLKDFKFSEFYKESEPLSNSEFRKILAKI